MRKFLWMIPVVLLFTALGSPTARADTIVQSGGIVTAIDGITIAGTTYNVTFGTTDDTTFAGSGNAFTAMIALSADLTPYMSVNTPGITQVGVDAGALIDVSGLTFVPQSFIILSQEDSAAFAGDVSNGLSAYAEFAPTATPEPETLTLTGIGLLGLLAVIRKRVALRHAQAT